MWLFHNSVIAFSVLILYLVKQYDAKSIEGKIIGGEIADAGHYPFLAAIDIQTSDSTFFCGGTILNNEWILTAAQCVDGAVLFTILLGTKKLDGNDETSVKVATSSYVLHPDYNPLTLDNDVGLIKLHMPVPFTAYIRGVEFLALLPVSIGFPSIAIGWGQTSDKIPGLSNELMIADLTTITNEECRIVYGNQLTDNMICVVGNYNEGICIGDSGTPLIQYRGYELLVGVATFYSGNGCESTDPSGYTRVDPYAEWIRNVTGRIG